MDQLNIINTPEVPVINNENVGLGENIEISNQIETKNTPSNTERLNNANSAVSRASQGSITQLPPITTNQQSGLRVAASTPIITDDEDVIEKEWVAKAKKIVAETQNDPRRRSDEFTYIKHDYIKTRFGKDTKLPDKQAA